MREALSKVRKQVADVRSGLDGCVNDLANLGIVVERDLVRGGFGAAIGTALTRQRGIRECLDGLKFSLAGVDRTIEGAMREQVALDYELARMIGEEEAERRAEVRDALTGLPNRTLFINRLEHGLEQARRRKWTLAIMVLEIDRRAAAAGSEAHDDVLKSVARRLGVATRGEDTLARGEDNEFLHLLMDFGDAGNVAMIAERLARAAGEPFRLTIDGGATAPDVGVTIGAAIHPQDGTTATQLMKAARSALAKAKVHHATVAFA